MDRWTMEEAGKARLVAGKISVLKLSIYGPY